MFIFRKKRRPSGRFKTPIYPKNRNFHYFSKKRSALNFKTIAILLLFMAAAYFIFFSEFFRLKNILIENNVNLKKEDLANSVRESISRKFIGIIPLDNFFIADESSIRSFLSGKYPMIEQVEIKKSSYNALTINVTEKGSRIIWCKLNSCFYLDGNSVAFANAREELKLKDRPIKIFEQAVIDEESGDGQSDGSEDDPKQAGISNLDLSVKNEPGNANEEITPSVETPINVGDRVADSRFVQFLDDLDRLIAKKTSLHIKYYRTKGTGTREIIAYTDKNTRLYFEASENADRQTGYLATFLNESIDKGKINTLRYIYLKSDNKIFYK